MDGRGDGDPVPELVSAAEPSTPTVTPELKPDPAVTKALADLRNGLYQNERLRAVREYDSNRLPGLGLRPNDHIPLGKGG